jgi:hypothetical protein
MYLLSCCRQCPLLPYSAQLTTHAVQVEVCSTGAGFEQAACPSLPASGSDTANWLVEYDPFIENSQTQREIACQGKSFALSDVVGVSGGQCWRTPCQLIIGTLLFQQQKARSATHLNTYMLLLGCSISGMLHC